MKNPTSDIIYTLRTFHPNRKLHSDFGKSLYICNSLYINPRNEIKMGGPHTTYSTPLVYISLTKAMQHNCTTILQNIKSNVQKYGNIRKGEVHVINTPGYWEHLLECLCKNVFMVSEFFQVKIVAMVTKSRETINSCQYFSILSYFLTFTIFYFFLNMEVYGHNSNW